MSGEPGDGDEASGSVEPRETADSTALTADSAAESDPRASIGRVLTDGGTEDDESDPEDSSFEFGRVEDDTFDSDEGDRGEDGESTGDDESATDDTSEPTGGDDGSAMSEESDPDDPENANGGGKDGGGRRDAESTDADTDEGDASDAEPRDGDGDDAEDESSDTDGDEPTRAADDTPEAKTDGEGYVVDHPSRREHEPPDPDEDVGGVSTPPDDEEMPLADHIEEMMLRLAAALLVGSAMTVLGLFIAGDVIEHVWFNAVPGTAGDAHVYHPLELWLTRIKVAALAGVLFALPTFVYQCYLFMRPGLYPHERKYYLASVPFSLVLAAVGMFVSYRFVLPLLFRYFTYYAEASAEIAYGLGATFDLVVVLTAFMAVVFQIPLFITLAIMMGVTTRRWLADKRLYFWAAFFGIAFMFGGVDLTMTAPIIIGLIMVALFEGTLLVLKWVGTE